MIEKRLETDLNVKDRSHKNNSLHNFLSEQTKKKSRVRERANGALIDQMGPRTTLDPRVDHLKKRIRHQI